MAAEVAFDWASDWPEQWPMDPAVREFVMGGDCDEDGANESDGDAGADSDSGDAAAEALDDGTVKKGMMMEAQDFDDDKWYACRIGTCHRDGTYKVFWADGFFGCDAFETYTDNVPPG